MNTEGTKGHGEGKDDAEAQSTQRSAEDVKYKVTLLGFVILLVLAAASAVAAQEPSTGAPEEVEFNPLKAEKNLEVGKYYLKKGNYDAAIDRLKDAIRYKSNFAEPHRLLGEAYEKKGNSKEAISYYEKYLAILPSAEDADKVRKRIEKLQEQAERKARRAG